MAIREMAFMQFTGKFELAFGKWLFFVKEDIYFFVACATDCIKAKSREGKDMFKEEIKLYVSRCEKFIKRITLDCFVDDVPLYAECAVTDDPVPFSGKDSLQFHPVQEGEIWGSTWQSGWFHLEGSVPESWPTEDCFLFLNWSIIDFQC